MFRKLLRKAWERFGGRGLVPEGLDGPIYWKLQKGKYLPMTPQEIKEVLSQPRKGWADVTTFQDFPRRVFTREPVITTDIRCPECGSWSVENTWEPTVSPEGLVNPDWKCPDCDWMGRTPEGDEEE